jgi:hypothetical protein
MDPVQCQSGQQKILKQKFCGWCTRQDQVLNEINTLFRLGFPTHRVAHKKGTVLNFPARSLDLKSNLPLLWCCHAHVKTMEYSLRS